MSSIELKKVCKSYDHQKFAVKDFSLTIKDGEFLVIVGPSGCGKSTTLRMIAGLEQVSSGELLIDQVPMTKQMPQKRNLAMVFQEYALYPHLTVYKNLAYPLKIKKLRQSEIDDKVRKTAQLLGIESLLARKPKQLSGGQKQRVALGRALVRDPHAFLMDEPLSNLDAKLRIQMRYEIARLHRRLHATMVYVTHDQTEAMSMGDRIVVMNHGEIQQIGTPEEIYHQPSNLFVANFLGTPQLNTLQFDNVMGTINVFQETLTVGNYQQVTVGLRPENLLPCAGNQYEIKLIENWGSESFWHVADRDQKNFVVRGTDQLKVTEGSRINLKLRDVNEAFIFDTQTGLRITD